MDYTKIIFVSKENVLLGPMAEWIMKSILMDQLHLIMGRQVLTNGGKQKNRIMEIVKAIRMKSGCFFDTKK